MSVEYRRHHQETLNPTAQRKGVTVPVLSGGPQRGSRISSAAAHNKELGNPSNSPQDTKPVAQRARFLKTIPKDLKFPLERRSRGRNGVEKPNWRGSYTVDKRKLIFRLVFRPRDRVCFFKFVLCNRHWFNRAPARGPSVAEIAVRNC